MLTCTVHPHVWLQEFNTWAGVEFIRLFRTELLSYGLLLPHSNVWMHPMTTSATALSLALQKSNTAHTSNQNTSAKIISLSTRSLPTTAVCPPTHHSGPASSLLRKSHNQGEVLPLPSVEPSPIFRALSPGVQPTLLIDL